MSRFCAKKWRPVGGFARYILKNRRRFSVQNVAVFCVAAAMRQRSTHTRLQKPPAPSHDSPLPSPSPNAKIVRPALAHGKSVAATLHHRISNTSKCFKKFTRRDNIRICPWDRSIRVRACRHEHHRARIINNVWLVCVFCCCFLSCARRCVR